MYTFFKNANETLRVLFVFFLQPLIRVIFTNNKKNY